MNRPLRGFLCAVIVAAGARQTAAATVASEDVPVPGGVAVLAAALHIDPVPDRGRFMWEITRLVHETAEIRNPAVAAFLQAIRLSAEKSKRDADTRASDLVPVPLSAEVWGDAIFHRRVAPDELVHLIIADRQASLMCHGLAGLDDPTLQFFAEHPSLLTRLYERSAPAFAAFSGSLRIRDNRVVPPGDADAALLWEAVAIEKVTRAERFVPALFELSEGRIAYLYDTIGQLDPPRRAFALGAWLPTPAARLDRFKVLATNGLNSLHEWHVRVLPFGRSAFDLAMALLRVDVAENGAPAEPSSLALWSKVFGGPAGATDARIDAAWIAELVASADVRHRVERLDQLSFAQRNFAREAGDDDVAFTLRSMPRYRGLVLALERMGVKRPATYASAIRHAAKLGPIEGRRGFIAQAQLQGALALVARMRAVGTLDAAAAERMVERIVASPFTDDTRYAGALAHWFQTDLRPLLPAARDAEGAVLAGLSGPSEDSTPLPRVTWEGQQYRLDFAGAERRRLQRVREKQGAIPLDLALQLADAGRMLGMEAVQPDDLRDLATQMTAIAADIPQRSKEEETDNVPIGVTVPASAHETLRKAAEELTRASRGKDAKRNPKLAEPLVELGDDLFARSLLSLAYAMDVGDPDGTVLLADDVSQRHDFGFSIKDNDARARVVWSVPRQDISPNSPWHVTGSLLGLDMALSSLALRRVSSDHVLEAPRLTSNARDTFAASVSLLNPLELRDGDRDAIVDAVERGRRRLLGGVDPRALDAMADELMMDGARRRALGWTRAHEPERLPLMLSLTELLTLGGGRTADLHAWGMAVTATSGCLCSRLLPPGHWATLSGRPQLGLSAAILPDLGFRVAAMLKELGLPSPLAKVILSGAMQDFIDEVKPTDDNDWLTLSRAARVITRERIEDYIAAATATGPLMPESLRAPER